ncbi:MAG: ribonuclease HII [Roseburia sp.]|nr:ribonuclease HII [Roseburia sp.]
MSSAEALRLQNTLRLMEFDRSLHCDVLCGIDEAGRGPFAGPVSVCACVMPLDIPIIGINDSKKLSEKMREELFDKITAVADYCVVLIDCETVDRINILRATKLGMKKAVEGLKNKPQFAVVDAVKGLDIDIPYSSVIKGDAKSYSVAAASIVAKVTRDRYMQKLDAQYPQYGFARNKGYGTAEHIAAIQKFGACPQHRRTFIKKYVTDGEITEQITMFED